MASLCLVGEDFGKAKFIWDVANTTGVMIPVFFYLFVSLFCAYECKPFLIFVIAQAALFVILTIFNLMDFSIIFSEEAFYYARAKNIPYLIEIICWLSAVFYSHWILYKFLKAARGEKKIEARYLFIGVFIGFFSGGAAHWLYVFGFPIHPAWNVFITVYLLLVTYAIFRYKLLGIDFAIRRGLAYTVLISLVTAFYFVFMILLERIFQRSIGYLPAYSISVLISAVLLGEPLRRWIQHRIDKLFYKGDIGKLHSENMMLENEIIKQDKMKSVATLAAGMAHEIKNPLTSIRTFAEFLPKKYDDPEFRTRFSALVVDEVDRVNSIIQQLLDFSKPKDLDIQRFELGELIRETLNLMNSNLLKNKIDVGQDIAPDLLIAGDRRQLKQVFINLFLNAIQAMPSGGTLKILANKTLDGDISVIVEDTGPGIPKEHLSHIFDPFYTTKETGSGLGLAVVHGIISRHGGKIKAQNVESGGAEISVFLKN